MSTDHPERPAARPASGADPAGVHPRVPPPEDRDRRWVVPRVSLSAVVVGTVLAIAVLFLLNLLGIGVGLAAFDPATGGATAEEFGIGAAIWGIVSLLVALFAGGWVAGRLAGDPNRVDGFLHGLATWALALIVVMWLATTAIGALVGGAFAMVGGATTGLQEAVAGEDIGAALQQELEQALPEDAETDPEALGSALRQLIVEGGDRDAFEDVLVRQGGLSEEEAERAADEMEEDYRQAVEDVQAQAEQVADAAATGAIWSFVGLILAAAVAGFGGWAGAPRDDISQGSDRR